MKDPIPPPPSSPHAHRWTNEKLDTLIAMWNEGTSADDIGRHFGVTPMSIVQRLHTLRKLGIQLKPRKRGVQAGNFMNEQWSKADIKKLVQLWKSNHAMFHIAKVFNRTVPAVNAVIQRLRNSGIDIPLRGGGTVGGKALWSLEALKKKHNTK